MLFEKLRGSALSVSHKTLYLRNIKYKVQSINTTIADASAADFDTLLDQIGDIDVHLTSDMFFQFEEWCNKYARPNIHQTLYITLVTGDGAFARAIALLKMRAIKKNMTLHVTVTGWPHNFSRSLRAGHSFAQEADKIVSLTDIIPHCLEFGSVTPRTLWLYTALGLLGMPVVIKKPATELDLQKSA